MRRKRKSRIEKGKKDLIQTRGWARANSSQPASLGTGSCFIPTGARKCQATQQNRGGGGYGERSCRTSWVAGPQEALGSTLGLEWLFLSRKTNAGLVRRFVCVFAFLPGTFCLFSTPRLSLRQATLRAQASRISGACASAQTKCAEPLGAKRGERGFPFPGADCPQLPQLWSF